MGTVEHAHQSLLVIDAGEHQDNGGVGGDQIQVVLGEVKVDDLQSNVGVVSGSRVVHHTDASVLSMTLNDCADTSNFLA